MKHDQNRYKWRSQFKRHVRETVYSWSLGRQKIVVNLNPAESALQVHYIHFLKGCSNSFYHTAGFFIQSFELTAPFNVNPFAKEFRIIRSIHAP